MGTTISSFPVPLRNVYDSNPMLCVDLHKQQLNLVMRYKSPKIHIMQVALAGIQVERCRRSDNTIKYIYIYTHKLRESKHRV